MTPRTTIAAGLTALALAGAGTGVALGAGQPAGASAKAGDDGLTHRQAASAREAALRASNGVIIGIDRDRDQGRTTYQVDLLPSSGRVREVVLSSAFRIVRRGTDERPDGLSAAAADRARRAATKRVAGIVTGVDTEDEGRTRYEVEVLRTDSTERTVELDAGFGVVRVTRDAADGDD